VVCKSWVYFVLGAVLYSYPRPELMEGLSQLVLWCQKTHAASKSFCPSIYILLSPTTKRILSKDNLWAGLVAHAFNPSTREAEASGFLSSRPAWSTKWVPGQPGLHRETLSRKNKQTKKKTKQKNNKKRQPLKTKQPAELVQRFYIRFLISFNLCNLTSWWGACVPACPCEQETEQFLWVDLMTCHV